MPATSVSVVICAYSDERREQLYLAIQSVAGQRVAPLQIIAVIDHNERLMQDVAKRFPGITVIANRHRKGAHLLVDAGRMVTGLSAADFRDLVDAVIRLVRVIKLQRLPSGKIFPTHTSNPQPKPQ